MKTETLHLASARISQNDLAYSRLKDGLTMLFYKPGEYMNTAVLMQDLQLGRTPINHALHRLSTEGLVQIIPRKGVMVAPLSIDDALHMIDVRLANEGLCARLAVRRITKKEIGELKKIAVEFDAVAQKRDIHKMMSLDRQFHEVIAQSTKNTVLIEILRVLHAKSQRFWAISLSNFHHVTEVEDEHQKIIKALESGDADAAEQAMNAHILSFRNALVQRQEQPV